MELDWSEFPGAEFVTVGLTDLGARRESMEAFLVSIGAQRLRQGGIDVPEAFTEPEHRLYQLLATEDPDSAHGRYNAYIRRLVSFERALECAA